MDTKGGWSVGASGPVQQIEGVGVESGRGEASTALAYQPTSPIPHAQPGVGYICIWSVGAAGLVQQPEQTR